MKHKSITTGACLLIACSAMLMFWGCSSPTTTTAMVLAVSAGRSHTMILKQDGTLWATGSNREGQLGDGTYKDTSTAKKVMDEVSAVSAGGSHTMILKQDGTLMAVGSNESGQLGIDSTEKNLSTPRKVMSGVAAVFTGDANTFILKQDGTLMATGFNEDGQLGDGMNTNLSKPKTIEITEVAFVAAGNAHTLFLKKDGTLWATGSNASGQFGDRTTQDQPTPKKIMGEVAAVSAGDSYTLILKKDGTLLGAGRNNLSQLGDDMIMKKGRSVHFWPPLKVKNPKTITTSVASMSAGNMHVLILKKDGILWGVGSNSFGQLGLKKSEYWRSVPYLEEVVITNVSSMSAGGLHTMMIKNDGTLWATGNNDAGQLGDGTKTRRIIPVQIES